MLLVMFNEEVSNFASWSHGQIQIAEVTMIWGSNKLGGDNLLGLEQNWRDNCWGWITEGIRGQDELN